MLVKAVKNVVVCYNQGGISSTLIIGVGFGIMINYAMYSTTVGVAALYMNCLVFWWNECCHSLIFWMIVACIYLHVFLLAAYKMLLCMKMDFYLHAQKAQAKIIWHHKTFLLYST